MANIISTILKSTICIFLLAISLKCSNGTRILLDTTNDITPVAPLPTSQPDTSGPIDKTDTPVEDLPPTLPSDQTTTIVAPAPVVAPTTPLPTTTPSVATPATNAAPVVTPVGVTTTPGGATPTGGAGVVGAAGGAVAGGEHPTLSFFMHDVLGGTHATSRVVAGIVANSDANVVPFSTPNSQVFPITGGVPLNNINGIVNNNNLPFLAGFNGNNPNNPNANTVLQNTGNNNVVNGGKNLPFVAAGQLPAGITLQQLMFGSITVIDNEITEGHELGTGVLGRGQGFYLSSSLDGSSHTFALTTLFHGSDHEVDDTISFFGVHRTASEISHIAVIGGTGKYEEAKGYATIESLPQVNDHTTDGVETVVHVNVYLTTP
ncbi:putative dirigent protein [Helianthus anomalus]